MTEAGADLDAALRRATARLAGAGVDDPRREARLLLAHATGIDRTAQLTRSRDVLNPTQATSFSAMVERRARREPMAYIIGRREFFGLDFTVTPDVLIPRPETELVVEQALGHCPKAGTPRRILDIATGSGCLLVTLLHSLPASSGIGTDRSAAALGVARRNVERLGVVDRAHLLAADWAQGVTGSFELIVCNPPYLATAELAALQPEVGRFEPAMALDGGSDGLGPYRALPPDLTRLLAPGGHAILEIGAGQDTILVPWFEEHGFEVATARDLAGITRVLDLGRHH